MAVLANRAWMSTATAGTGTITLGSALSGFQTFGDAGITDGQVVAYTIVDGAAWEVGTGTYTSSGTTLTRTVTESSNSDSAVSLSGSATVFITPRKQDLLLPGRNAIINGAFMAAQRGTSFTDSGSANNDDTYNLDRWTLLSDGNDVVDVSQETSDVPTAGLNALKMLVVTVNKKFGVIQFIEQKNCIGLIGETVTLSFKAKVNNTTRLDKIKAAIIAWDGTADTVTSDVVSAWGVDGTTPTMVANWTLENTPADLGVTTSWASYSITAAVDTASAKNIAVFIWSDNVTDTDAADYLLLADVQLEYGTNATLFDREAYSQTLAKCQRYYFRRSSNSTNDYIGMIQGYDSNSSFGALEHLPVQMRVTPTVAASAASDLSTYRADGSARDAASAVDFDKSTVFSIAVTDLTSANITAGQATILTFNSATGWIAASAEL